MLSFINLRITGIIIFRIALILENQIKFILHSVLENNLDNFQE